MDAAYKGIDTMAQTPPKDMLGATSPNLETPPGATPNSQVGCWLLQWICTSLVELSPVWFRGWASLRLVLLTWPPPVEPPLVASVVVLIMWVMCGELDYVGNFL